MDKFPSWCDAWSDEGLSENIYYALSDDIDSLLSCMFLKKFYGGDIKYFYDFKNLYMTGDFNSESVAIGVDIDFFNNNAKSWGNHVVAFNSKEDLGNNRANLNAIDKINLSNYFDKYAGNTLLQVLSYYDYNINNLNDDALMLLLCIDSTYMGNYTGYSQASKAHKYYLCDVLGFNKLYELEQEKTSKDFEQIKLKYNISQRLSNGRISDYKILINNKGYLKYEDTFIDFDKIGKLFDIKIELPKGKFDIIDMMKKKSVKAYVNRFSRDMLDKNTFSLAIIRKNANYSDNVKTSIRIEQEQDFDIDINLKEV